MHKILLVDDMRRFIDLTQSFLSRAECSMLTAATGLEAIKVAERERPDLIVLDIEMPEMNGIEACRFIKAHPELHKAAVIMLTSLTNRREEAMRAGANSYLTKPVDEETFLAEITKFLPIVQRQEKRHAVTLDGLAAHEGKTHRVTVSDLSKSGAFLRGLPSTPTIAEQMTLTMAIPGGAQAKEIDIRVVVVRGTDHGVGVRFAELTSGARMYLDDFLESLGSAAAAS